MSEDRDSGKTSELRETFLSKTHESDGTPHDNDYNDSFGALDLSDQTKQAVTSESKRRSLQLKTNVKTDMRCRVCSSKFFSIYQEWLSMHNYSGRKCSTLARKYFSESISAKSFTNHKKAHMQNPHLVRRLMIAEDPQIDPRKVISSMIQILHMQLIETEFPDPKMLAQLKDFLSLLGDYTGETKKVPEKAVQINTYNIGNGRSVPMAEEERDVAESTLTEEEEETLRSLGVLLEGRGTSATRAQIPKKVPSVSKKEQKIIDVDIREE